MMEKKYSDYFTIDENYYPAVNEKLIEEQGDTLWQGFYPHDTFITLLKNLEDVISRRKKQSVWVEGEYGTGKSHAILTAKKIIDSDEYVTKDYFDKYKILRKTDLYNKIQGLKQQGKIVTVHTYGSSSITSDNELVIKIQQAITKELQKRGMKVTGLKESIIEWLNDSANKNFFNELISGEYKLLFDNETVDSIINKLETSEGEILENTVSKIIQVGKERGMEVFTMDIPKLLKWIETVIETNNIKSMLFFWDEFTEYFKNNMRSLTGFQQIAELATSVPFNLIIVTHLSSALFDSGGDAKKVMDRFVTPRCKIELPQEMAFKLIGGIMQETENPHLRKQWLEDRKDIYLGLERSNKKIKQYTKANEEEIEGVLPLHPYSVVLLKELAVTFSSNQRSIFDFIKNKEDKNIKSFPWFIENHSQQSDWNVLTIDMLWSFFENKDEGKMKEKISYYKNKEKKLSEDERRVVKTIVLLQSISEVSGNKTEIFLPNENNINLAFEGTQFGANQGVQIADKLVEDEIIYTTGNKRGEKVYSIVGAMSDTKEIDDNVKKYIESKKTKDFLEAREESEIFKLSDGLNARMKFHFLTIDNVTNEIKKIKLRDKEEVITAIVLFGKNEEEKYKIESKIKDLLKENSNYIYIDTTDTPFGEKRIKDYAKAIAYKQYYRSKNGDEKAHYEREEKNIINTWLDEINNNDIYISRNREEKKYTEKEIKCESERGIIFKTVKGVAGLEEELKMISQKFYNLSLDEYEVKTDLYNLSGLQTAAKAGIEEVIKGALNTPVKSKKLENALEGALKLPNYWEVMSTSKIAKIKKDVDELIRKKIKRDGRVSIVDIYDMLSKEPYGFLVNKKNAFIVGFLLKEYSSNTYKYSDGENAEPMTEDKLAEMIKDVMEHKIKDNSKYIEKYICELTNDEKIFGRVLSKITNIDEESCSSYERGRDALRRKTNELQFPLWTLKYIEEIKNDEILEELVRICSLILNSKDTTKGNTEINYCASLAKYIVEVGEEEILEKATGIINKENILEGLENFIKEYRDGILERVGEQIGDNKAYVEILKRSISDKHIWAWDEIAIEKELDNIILDYEIILESYDIGIKKRNIEECIAEWRTIVSSIKISNEILKDEKISIKNVLSSLNKMVKHEKNEENKKEFLKDFKIEKVELNKFFNDQLTAFNEIFEEKMEELTEEEKKIIFDKIEMNSFEVKRRVYEEKLNIKVNEMKENSKKSQLKNMWLEGTGTNNTKEWSKKYNMPILAMVDQESEIEAREVFVTIDSTNQGSGKDIEKAIEFLRTEKLLTYINDEEEQEKRFKEKMIKEYEIVVGVEEIKRVLLKESQIEPHNWYGSQKIADEIKKYVTIKYNSNEVEKAIEEIDNIEEKDIREYLKELIKSNMEIGITILNKSKNKY